MTDMERLALFAEIDRVYLDLVRHVVGVDGILRDLLELTVWEDYGLIRRVEGFLGGLAEEHADLVVRELAAIIGELRRERLDYELAKAIRLRKVVLAPWRDVREDDSAAGE